MSAREQLPATAAEVYELFIPDDFGLSNFRSDAALQLIDEVITDLYLPARGQAGYKTERAIFVEASHVPHRENNAEHTFHLGNTVIELWYNRERLGLDFPRSFDLGKAVLLAQPHDSIENWSGDVDAMTPSTNLLEHKAAGERAAAQLIRKRHPNLRGTVELWETYERKDCHESRFVSDLDKITSTRVICLDGGKKWHNWEGNTTSRELMCSRQRAKLLTPLGYLLFDALERDLDNHPEYFPQHNVDPQGTLF